jgi:hypothetical protein
MRGPLLPFLGLACLLIALPARAAPSDRRHFMLTYRAAPGCPGEAAFHASLVSGLGVGIGGFRYTGGSVTAGSHHPYIAPYTGVLVSGGIPILQMFSGLRLAASQTLGTSADLTLYPVLAFGVGVRPEPLLRVFLEGDLAAAYTTEVASDSGILGAVTAGMSITFGRLQRPLPDVPP